MAPVHPIIHLSSLVPYNAEANDGDGLELVTCIGVYHHCSQVQKTLAGRTGAAELEVVGD